MADIVITAEHTHRHDIDSDMLAELGQDINQLDPSLEVSTGIIARKDVEPDPVTLITAWIPTATFYAGVLHRAVGFARHVLARDDNDQTPIRIDILGPDGHPIRSALVRNPVTEPEDITEATRQLPPRRRPPEPSR